MTNGPLYIPANEIKTFNTKYLMNSKATIFSVAPHMHLIGRSIKAYGLTPTNDTIKFIDIPKWDFHWQGFYNFKNDKKLILRVVKSIITESYRYYRVIYSSLKVNFKSTQSQLKAYL